MEVNSRNRKIFLFEGVIFLILGILAIALPAFSSYSITWLIGWILLIGGVVSLYRTLSGYKTPSFWIAFINAFLAIVIGILLLIYPLQGMMFLTLMLGIFFFFEGLTEIALALQVKYVMRGWGWLMFSGIIAILLALVIWSGWPQNSVWIMGLLVGINFIFFGLSLIVFANLYREMSFRD